MVSLHGFLFSKLDQFFLNLEKFWFKFRTFFHENKTLSDITFLIVYTFEQLALFLLILAIPKYSPIFAGTFAIIFISTISFEKVCMESRYKFLNKNMVANEHGRENLIRQYELIAQDNERLKLALGLRLKGKK